MPERAHSFSFRFRFLLDDDDSVMMMMMVIGHIHSGQIDKLLELDQSPRLVLQTPQRQRTGEGIFQRAEVRQTSVRKSIDFVQSSRVMIIHNHRLRGVGS